MRHKNKRGARGSTESTDLDQTNAKRFQEESNVVVTEDSEEVEEGIEDNEELNLFINAVNSFHLALKYTWEISENSLAFLDIKLSINDNGLSTSVHYKPTDSHNYLLHSSSHP